MATILAFLNANPAIAAALLPLLFGVVGHLLDGTPAGKLLQALGVDFAKLASYASKPAALPGSLPGSGQAQPNPTGDAAPGPRAAGVVLFVLAGLAARDLVACSASQKALEQQVIHAAAPFACAELANVTSGGATVAQLCDASAAVAADLLLTQMKADAGRLGAATCGRHEQLLDAHGSVLGWACSSLAGDVAARVGGSVVR